MVPPELIGTPTATASPWRVASRLRMEVQSAARSGIQRSRPAACTAPGSPMPYSSSGMQKSPKSRLVNRAAQTSICRASSTSHISTTGQPSPEPTASTTRSAACLLLSASASPRDTAASTEANRCARTVTVMS
jgi:hypothetical protein